jgi:hypothetical protein
MTLSQVEVEHVLTFTAYTGKPSLVAGAPQGTRGILEVTGGTFEGPRLKGTITPPGGDWFTVRPSGVLKVDVRLLLTTDDQANILMTYSGVAIRRDGGMHIRVAPTFEAPEGPYEWLNDIQAVGFGDLIEGGVKYDVYALR